MMTKHLVALFGLSTCFVYSSLINSTFNKSSLTPPESNLPGANEENRDNQSTKTGSSNEITKISVTFDLNGGRYNGETTFTLNNVLPTSYFAYLAEQAPGSADMDIIYPYHSFRGYSLAENNPILIPSNYIVEDNITVYAQYDIDASKDCVVNWRDVNSTILATETYAVGDTPFFKGQIPMIEDKAFAGWSPKPTVITQAHADTGTINYVATYLDVANSHTVTLDYGNGESLHTQTVVHNGYVVEPQITYTGHHITQWNYVTGGTGTFTFDTPITSDITIQATWALDTCNITYVANGGTITGTPTTSVDYNTTVTIPPTLADRPGYDKTQVTWWTTDTFTQGTQFTFGAAGTGTPVTSDITLYAKWGNIKTYTVHFFDDSVPPVEYNNLKETNIEYNQRAYRPATDPTKTNYSFAGWYTSTDYTTPFDFTTPLTASATDINVYAKFTKNQYRVRWLNADRNHTPLVDAEYYDAGELPVYKGTTVPVLAPDVNHRYQFKGFSPDILPVDDNMTYYATYDYDDEINFHYVTDSFPLEEKFDYESIEIYGGIISLKFDTLDIAAHVLSLASFTIDGVSYTTSQLGADIFQSQEQEHPTNYINIVVSLASQNEFMRNAKSIEMEVMSI